MARTLSVWEFDTPAGAGEAKKILADLETQGLIRVSDGAIVTWAEGAKRPRTEQFHSMAGAGAMSGSFWGFLFGLIFFVPLLGLAIGAASGALAGALTDVGIDDTFIKKVRDEVKPGTSALFAMTSDAVVDKVADAFRGSNAKLLQTNLSNEQESALKEAFAD